MNTNKLKSFAKQARIDLIDGVGKQLLYWGFSKKGEVLETPETISGGYIFRGNAFNDQTVVPKWEQLKRKVTASKEGFSDTAEEGAYTWFNRLLAIKILEENGFIEPVLAFQEETLIPAILANAKSGRYSVSNTSMQSNLQNAIRNNEDEKAFALLITDFCNQHHLLKEVFGRLNDYTELLIPQNLLAHNGFLVALNDVENIESDDYKEVELIGWLYQFYVSDRKDEVFKGFKKRKKARAEDIPAATQIFTPKWIVSYMVENTLGKIYLDFAPDSDLKGEMKYLVESEEEASADLISELSELTLIDPASGSGHILVTGFEWLYKMYREQKYSPINSVKDILRDNIYGLEIDDRAMQLSRFAVLLKAGLLLQQENIVQAKEFLNNPQGFIPNIYAFPEEQNFVSEEIALFTENQQVSEIAKAIDLLRQGKNIGSTLKLDLSEEAIITLNKQSKIWNEKATNGTLNIEEIGIWEKLKPYIEIAITLTNTYTSVVANPPYMKHGNMNGGIKDYVKLHYPLTKSDLFAVFMEVCLGLCIEKGLMGMINQHSWMFLSSYEKYRVQLLKNYIINSMLHLGSRTFEELSGEVVQSTAFVLQNFKKVDARGNYYRLVDYKNNEEKEINFLKRNNYYPNISQTNFNKIPGNPTAYWASEQDILILDGETKLGSIEDCKKGADTGNNDRFLRFWFEVSKSNLDFNKKWIFYNKGGPYRRWYGNYEYVINWENDGKELKASTANLRSQHHYFKDSITWNALSSGNFCARFSNKKTIFDSAGSSLIYNKHKSDYFFYLGLLNSSVTQRFLLILNPTFNYGAGTVAKLPVIYSKESQVKELTKLNFENSKSDWDSREVSRDFEINPLLTQKEDSIKGAFIRWQHIVSQDFFQLHQNEEELNRIFIEVYGLQDELAPDVLLRDITILQDELKADDLDAIEEMYRNEEQVELPIQKDVVIQQLLSYFIGVLLGRYRLDKGGLHIAHPNPSESELKAYRVEDVSIPFSMEIDEDGILPIMGSNCAFPDDAVKRIQELIHHIWGDDTMIENQNFIQECLGMSMEDWLTKKFWTDCHLSGKKKRIGNINMYGSTPIYWLFSSNPKKPQNAAFNVLVYMHRMNAYTVQQILRNYLHPHQEYINQEIEKMQRDDSSLDRTGMKKLEKLQESVVELSGYEQKLKAVANEQITFDLDDGVKVNYEKFEGVVAEI